MADHSSIEWTDASWNPTVGCSVVSPGCTNCYAMRLAYRFGCRPKSKFRGTAHRPKKRDGERAPPVWTGVVRLDEGALLAPLYWSAPRRIFVNSMSDLFHEALTDAEIDQVFAVMALCPQHNFQVLTKRPMRMRDYFAWTDGEIDRAEAIAITALQERFADRGRLSMPWPLPNVWLGTSVEDQERADQRIPYLLATPAAVRFLSCEPLLGPVDLNWVMRLPSEFDKAMPGAASVERYVASALYGAHGLRMQDGKLWWEAEFSRRPRLDWVIAGGESGPGARPMHPAWARGLRDQCAAAGVPFFFKQWGEWAPYTVKPGGDLGGEVRAGRVEIVHPTAQSHVEVSEATGGRSTLPGSRYMEHVGKKAAGRLLDGIEHNAFPRARAAAVDA